MEVSFLPSSLQVFIGSEFTRVVGDPEQVTACLQCDREGAIIFNIRGIVFLLNSVEHCP
jgi:hypothetical protein